MSTKYSGLEAALRSARMTFVSEANAGDRTGTEIIACEDLLPAWTKEGPKGDGSHEVGAAGAYSEVSSVSATIRVSGLLYNITLEK